MIALAVNGQKQVFEGDPSTTLILYLRDVLKIQNLRYGCLMSSCKSCMVYVDSVRCLACAVTMSELENKSVTTAPQW